MGPSLGNELPPTQLLAPASLIPEVADVFAHFCALIALARERFQGELGGKLLLFGQLDAQGAAVALATNIAGGAALGVDADPERLRQGIRHGFCDFVVNNLNEALRILKNEIRKKRPVSVCLEGDLAATLQEAVERGLQPDLLALPGRTDAVRTLIQRGAIVIAAGLAPDVLPLSITWNAESVPALWLPKVAALAAQILPEGDERLRWLKLAPRYIGRTIAGQHYLQMTVEEADKFTISVADAMESGAIGTKIMIQRQAARLAGPPR